MDIIVHIILFLSSLVVLYRSRTSVSEICNAFKTLIKGAFWLLLTVILAPFRLFRYCLCRCCTCCCLCGQKPNSGAATVRILVPQEEVVIEGISEPEDPLIQLKTLLIPAEVDQQKQKLVVFAVFVLLISLGGILVGNSVTVGFACEPVVAGYRQAMYDSIPQRVNINQQVLKDTPIPDNDAFKGQSSYSRSSPSSSTTTSGRYLGSKVPDMTIVRTPQFDQPLWRGLERTTVSPVKYTRGIHALDDNAPIDHETEMAQELSTY